MDFSLKEILGLVAVVLTLIFYFSYIWHVFKGHTKPHLFSWLIWGVITLIVFAGQLVEHAGAGAWVSGTTAILCLVIAVFGFRQGEKNITRSDWVSFTGAALAILVWYVTRDPLGAVILAALIDVMALYPTLRKSYHQPYHESPVLWTIISVRSLVWLLALENYSLVTVLFPVATLFTNCAATGFLIWRRTVLSRSTP